MNLHNQGAPMRTKTSCSFFATWQGFLCVLLGAQASCSPRRHEDAKNRKGFVRVFVSSWLYFFGCDSGKFLLEGELHANLENPARRPVLPRVPALQGRP